MVLNALKWADEKTLNKYPVFNFFNFNFNKEWLHTFILNAVFQMNLHLDFLFICLFLKRIFCDKWQFFTGQMCRIEAIYLSA